ncbi:MAG: cysteine desulfurase [Gemmatimonadetes bacterium]|nr:cysteine desulfurase [Gemmatimonadota bacterium]
MSSIYLDHAATTPIRSEVREGMIAVLDGDFGNPSSAHGWGRRAAARLEEARERVAQAIGADRSEIYFVRGGTESDNMAILGHAEAVRGRGGTPFAVVSAIEHKAVLGAAAEVANRGGRWSTIPVYSDGTLDMEVLDTTLADGASIVSVMTVNNEVGIHLPIEDVAERTRAHEVVFHTDAIQALGKVPVSVQDIPIDLLSLTGHKIYGAKGTGVLFVRRGVDITPLIFGGGQERALRPGTEDVAGAVGMSIAVDLAVQEQESEAARLRGLRDLLQSRLENGIDGLRIHGDVATRAPHILNVGIPNVDPEALLAGLDLEGIAASAGSACESGAQTASHVLQALYGRLEGVAALRFSPGHSTTENDVIRAAEATLTVLERMPSVEARA